jgi:quinoprotein glucose dehydrogenase
VVAQATKFGYLYVFNRVTGEPLWPIEERPVPQSDVPGEFSSPTQPFPTKPPPFARLTFTEKDINPFATEAEQAKIRDLLKNSRNEGLYTPPSLRGTISLPGHNGGANWGSVAVNPEKGFLYVITKEHPTLDKLELPAPVKADETGPARASSDPEGFIRYNAPINFMTVSTGLASIGPPWSTLTAYDLNSGTIRWQVPNGGVLDLEKEGHSNTGARDPRGGPVVTAGGLIFAATASDHKIRAYDEDTGAVLWEKELPVGSDGVPAVYQVGGREYLAFCVGAGNGLNFNFGLRRPDPSAPSPNAYVVFALPSK